MELIYNSFTTGDELRFNVLNKFVLQQSTQQYLNSEVQIDFSENLNDALWSPVQTDLPVKWQECKVYDGATLVFAGFLDTATLPIFYTGKENLHIKLSLYNPYVLACNRTISADLKGDLYTEILKIVSPLIADGYVVDINTIPTNKTVNRLFVERTIESILRQFSDEYNFIWHITPDKKINFIDSDGAFASNPVLTVDSLQNGCFNIQPYVQSVDYANVISVKNARVIEFYRRDANQLQGGQIIQLEYPFSISKTQLSKEEVGNVTSSTGFGVVDLDNTGFQAQVFYTKATDTVSFFNCAYSDDVDADTFDFLLIADPFDKTVITGFIINNTNAYTNIRIQSDTALVPTFKTIEIPDEITKMKGVVSDSGRVQTIRDVSTRIFTETELIDYAQNSLIQNASGTSLIDIENDEDLNLSLTDKVRINLPELLIDGDFVITEIKYTRNVNKERFMYKARNSNLTENFLDIYRKQQTETTQEEFDNQGFSVLVTDEELIEKPLVKIDGVLISED